MLNLLQITFITVLIVIIAKKIFKKPQIVINKNILIVGGTKGIGLELTKILSLHNNLTVIARSHQEEIDNVKYIEIDVTKNTKEIPGGFDLIFCCIGGCKIKNKLDHNSNGFKRMMELNYIGPTNVLDHLLEKNKKEFQIVFFCSTSVLITLPGYLAYEPSKAALFSLYKQINMLKENTGKLILLPNVKTNAFEEEKKNKNKASLKIESCGCCLSPDYTAEIILKELFNRNLITIDYFTYLLSLKNNCECLQDYFLFPISVFLHFITKIYVKKQNDKYTKY